LRRHLAGIIALVSLALAGVLWHWPITGFPGMAGGCVRVAMVFAVVWLAYDQVQRLPGWILAVMPVFLLLLLVRPRWALLALPVLLLLAALRPRPRK
jgi:hypothetical protein